MLYLSVMETFKTLRSQDDNCDGMIHVYPNPPKNLDNPQCSDEILNIDLVTVDTDPDPKPIGMKGWQRLKNCHAHWDNSDWRIIEVQPLLNGDSCFLIIERLNND